MASVNVRPLADRVLVKPLEAQETKKGGIIIPDAHKEKPQAGVRCCYSAPASAMRNGKEVIPFSVKKGGKSLSPNAGGTEIKVEGDTYLIMREDDILGILG